jgi:hypothetical protein
VKRFARCNPRYLDDCRPSWINYGQIEADLILGPASGRHLFCTVLRAVHRSIGNVRQIYRAWLCLEPLV